VGASDFAVRDATAPPAWALLLAFVSAYGPSIAAIITSLAYGESDGAVSFFRTAAGQASWRWYLLATLGPPSFVWCAAGIQALGGGQISMAGAQAPAKMMVVLGTFIPFGPLAEELGWRGYALPRLEKSFPPLLGSMILGIIRAAWHVPMFWFPPIGLPS
jgi:membrane protease YdiL (CAAX protease family)